MIIEKDKTYKNDALYDEFVEKTKGMKKVECEIVFENVYNTKKEIFDVIRVWFKDDLYGSSYTIRNGVLEIRSIDKCDNNTMLIENKNVVDLIIDDLNRIAKK